MVVSGFSWDSHLIADQEIMNSTCAQLVVLRKSQPTGINLKNINVEKLGMRMNNKVEINLLAVKPLSWVDCVDGSSHDVDCMYEVEPQGKSFRLIRAITGGVGYICNAMTMDGAKKEAQRHRDKLLSDWLN